MNRRPKVQPDYRFGKQQCRSARVAEAKCAVALAPSPTDTGPAMSQENVDLTYRAIDAVNRRDLGAYLALMDDDVEAFPLVAGIEGRFNGHEGIRRWWDGLFNVFPDFTTEIVEASDLGDLTVAALRLRGRGGGGDTPVDEAVWFVSRARRGKCTRWRIFQTYGEALEAVGLRE
jgi:ketosteroid isomerase-like protein